MTKRQDRPAELSKKVPFTDAALECNCITLPRLLNFFGNMIIISCTLTEDGRPETEVRRPVAGDRSKSPPGRGKGWVSYRKTEVTNY
jgi:hypothetical protein